MIIKKNLEGSTLTIALEGRLDTTTSPELEKELEQSLESVTELIWDFHQLEYISSAGLRVLLTTQKKMKENGSMKVIGCNEMILDIFETTGFSEFLIIE